MRIKRAITLGALGLLTSVFVLLAAIGFYVDVSSGSPDESTDPPSIADGATPPAPADIGGAVDVGAPPGPAGANEQPPPAGPETAGAADATPAAPDPAAECDRRLAANESVFVEALENGEGAAFHCTTTCTEPSVELNDSRARSVADLQAEVDEFVTTAESTADEAAEKFCLTESGYGEPKIEPHVAEEDPFIPADSGLQDPVTAPTEEPDDSAAGPGGSDSAPAAATPTEASPSESEPKAPTSTGSDGGAENEDEADDEPAPDPQPRRDTFIPSDVFGRDEYPRV